MMLFLQCEFVLSALGFALLALRFYRTSLDTLPKYEPFSRNRIVGIILGFPAMIMCIPHAQVVSPTWLIPWLWPLALVIPILCFYYIDYYASRAIGGILILYAYDVVHGNFEFNLPGAQIFTVFAWIIGIFAICVAGKPWLLRDLTRLAARSYRWRMMLVWFWILYSLLAIVNLALSF